MKKSLSVCLFLSLLTFLFADTYKIQFVKYNITPCTWDFLGSTKVYAINQNVPVDKDRVFDSIEELDAYLDDYEQQLNNLRAFESVKVYRTISEQVDEDGSHPVYLTSEVKDSMHLLAMPYGKYNSNSGTVFKLKVKDTNFLGTLNPLSGDINFALEQTSEDAKLYYSIGANFSFDYPFKAGIFDAVWFNDHAVSYTVGDPLPEWNIGTGLKFVLPGQKVSYAFEVDQNVINNFDYSGCGDALYFKETAIFSMPFTLMNIDNWGKVSYSPYARLDYCWDFDGISSKAYNYGLAGPNFTIGHSISTGRVNWDKNLRTGLSASLSNNFKYNFDRNILYPLISFETKAFKGVELYDGNWFSRFGLCADFYSFFYMMNYDNPYRRWDGNGIGGSLRGIRDSQYYAGTWTYACTVDSAITLNLDMPIHIFETNFQSRLLKYFNFDLQVSPFVDMALTYNKATNKWFDPKDGFYTAGFEVLVFPRKWSSYTVRGSVGVDIGRLLLSDYLNMDWRSNVSKYEITFGLGLHY